MKRCLSTATSPRPGGCRRHEPAVFGHLRTVQDRPLSEPSATAARTPPPPPTALPPTVDVGEVFSLRVHDGLDRLKKEDVAVTRMEYHSFQKQFETRNANLERPIFTSVLQVPGEPWDESTALHDRFFFLIGFITHCYSELLLLQN